MDEDDAVAVSLLVIRWRQCKTGVEANTKEHDAKPSRPGQ